MNDIGNGSGLTTARFSEMAVDLPKAMEPVARGRVALWLATAALAGGVMMGLELAAFRLYAPYFGYSVYVWGSMISVVMAALSAGYALGGRLADGAQPESALYRAVLTCAVYQLAVLYFSPALLKTLEEQGEFLGAGAATLLIFAPTMMSLAATGPLIVRLCAKAAQIGSAAGSVYAFSTAGGMAGIVVTTFGLLPRVGTHATLQVLCAVSFVVAGAGLATRIRYPVLVLAIAVAILCAPGPGWSQNTIWTGESAYNLIRVVRQGTRTVLLLNHKSSVHTIREEGDLWTGSYYDLFALGPLLVRTDRALVLGMGAGQSIASMRATAPQAAIDAVEIDPAVVRAAIQWFGIDPSRPGLRIHVADARPWLLKNRDSYDLVQIDLYQGGPYIPFYLVTKEFFLLVREHMTGGGMVMMNVFDAGPKHELLTATAATLSSVLPSVMVLPGAGHNYMLMGFAARQTIDEVRARIAKAPPEVSAQSGSLWASLGARNAPIFTDDRAPVEEMTRRMFADSRRMGSAR